MASVRKTIALVLVTLTLAAAYAPIAHAAADKGTKNGGEQTGGK